MRKATVTSSFFVCLCLAALGLPAALLAGADGAKGTLVVDAKPVEITHAYAFFDTSGNDGKDVVMVVLSDAPVPEAAVQSDYERMKLVDAGTLHYLELMVNSDKKETHYEVQHRRFGQMMGPGGDDGDHVFTATTFDGATIAGRARATSPQTSPGHVPYSYDITFTAKIAPMKQQ